MAMSQQINENENARDAWYVMWHLKPQHIETMLQKDCAGLFRKPDDPPLPPYRFYVPFQYMPILHEDKKEGMTDKRYKPQDDSNALRSDLHNFVFIQAPEDRVRAIVASDWNVKASVRLNYYRDTNRREVTISDTEVHLLMDVVQKRHLQFYLDQPLDDFAEGDKVVLQNEPWAGKRGIVKKVALKHGQLCMTISMNILGRTKSINFTDVHVGDVLFEDAERGRMLTDNPITNYEEEIIDLLSHRFGHRHNEDVAEADRQRLRRLATYDRIYVDDDYEQARFTALRLICAYLLQNAKKRDLYQQQVLDLLHLPLNSQSSILNSQLPSPSNPSEAYLMTALFITTRQACFRAALKEYRNSHSDCPDIFRRYLSIIKDIKTKKKSRNIQQSE